MSGGKTKNMRRLGMLNTSKKKKTIMKCPSSKKDTKKSLTQLKKAAAQKGNQVHDTRNNAKDQVERQNAAAAEAESTHTETEAQDIAAAETECTLAEDVAQETERRSMKRSSTVANQRSVPAQHEHRRQDGWTSTPRGSDDEKKGSERDMTAGERL